MDSKDDTYSNIPSSPAMKDFRIGIFFSGLERNLASSAYNNRVDECKASAFALYSYAVTDRRGDYDLGEGLKFKDMKLRGIPEEIYKEFGVRLPSSWQKRCNHFYSEMHRVEKGVECWEKGDLVSFGRLINESGMSSIVNYECGSPELIAIYEIMRTLPGVYGGRFSGAGFKGACVAIVDPTYKKEIEAELTRRYLEQFPEYEHTYKVYFVKPDNGARYL